MIYIINVKTCVIYTDDIVVYIVFLYCRLCVCHSVIEESYYCYYYYYYYYFVLFSFSVSQLFSCWFRAVD